MAGRTYLDFDLLIQRSEAGYTARILDSPVGRAAVDFTVPFSALELENFVLRVGRTRRGVRRLESPEMELARDFGGRLFEAIFGGAVGACLHRSLDEAYRQEAGLRLRLRLTDTPELVDLPWEYLYNPEVDRFLSLSAETPLVRYLDLPEPVRPLAVEPPLRVLVMISSPSDHPPLDVEQEWSKLKEAVADLERRGLLVLERVEGANLAALQRQLRLGEYHIFHFVGHGAFDERSQDGVLLLEDEGGRGRPVSGRDLGTMLYDHRSLRLVVLNACEGARSSRSDPFAGAAQSLVRQRIPAVIAMQFEITDRAAIALAHGFYTALVDGYPVDAALAEGRKAIFAQGNDVEWGTPVLYLCAPDGQIFDVEQARDEGQQPARTAAGTVPQAEGARPGERLPSMTANRRWIGIAVASALLLLVFGYAALKLFGPGGAGQPTPSATASATVAALVPEPTDTSPPGTAGPALTAVPLAGPTRDCDFEAQGLFAELWLTYQGQLGCPTAAEPRVTYDFEQQFENGIMFWLADDNFTYVLQVTDGGGTFQRFEVDSELTCSASPPAGLLQPTGGIGAAWCQLGGADAPIGWALSEEVGLGPDAGDPTLQEFERGAIFASGEGMMEGWAYVFFFDAGGMAGTFVQAPY